MIWIKRLAPVAILLLLYLTYNGYTRRQQRMNEQRAEQYASVVAQLWVASADYKDNPERFMEFRDSLLTAGEITVDELRGFLNKHEDAPERLLGFARLLEGEVDSLVAYKDSAWSADTADESSSE